MQSRYTKLEKIKKYLNSGEEIPHSLMLEALNEVTALASSHRERVVASSISERAGKYLDSEYLIDFISAKLSDQNAEELIARRKVFNSRFCTLLPSIINLLSISDSDHLASAIRQIYDCIIEFSIVEKSEIQKQQHKRITSEIEYIIHAAKNLDGAVAIAERNIDIEYSHHKDALSNVKAIKWAIPTLKDLRDEINCLIFVSELVLYRDQVGEGILYIGNNKARTHIVQHVYELSLSSGSPRLKTTPGSDFSLLCSLMFELATGIPDESLAGAINKFSRSALRQKIDSDEDILRYENSDEGMAERESDNFADVMQEAEALAAEEKFWQIMLSSRKWDENFQDQIMLRLLNAFDKKESALKRHGPFIVWASHISSKTNEEFRAKMEAHESKRLELAIEIGQRRRAERS